MTIQEFKNSAIRKLKTVSPSPALDVNVLLQHILEWDRTCLLAHNNEELSEENLKWLEQAVEKRLTGFPIAYITETKQFFGYDFKVTPDVLIPKPDTEILVERAIDLMQDFHNQHPAQRMKICDMCTGSGCIGISVQVTDCWGSQITMVDISPAALEIAKENARNLWLNKNQDDFIFIQSNLFESIPSSEKYDIILTNPPYIPASMVDDLLKDGRSEPRLALDGDVSITGDRSETDDGLEIIRNLLPQAAKHLLPEGTILLEAGEYNIEKVQSLAGDLGFSSKIHTDLEGQLRMIELKKF